MTGLDRSVGRKGEGPVGARFWFGEDRRLPGIGAGDSTQSNIGT